MEIKLNQIALDRFKGLKAFTLSPFGASLTVRGQNRIGKTTLMDAFNWLLFDKDSEGKTAFGIKGIGEQTGPQNNIEHTVEGVLEIDGSIVGLKKALRERWTKKRGQSRKEFTGHTTSYSIDGVPVKKKEWDDRLSQIIDEGTFRLLTDPHHFNNLHWQTRREILLEICGDVSDEEVIASNIALQDLTDILNGHGINDQKKVITGQRKKINERLNEIPARIDELDKSLADVPEINLEATRAEIERLNKEIEATKIDPTRAGLSKKATELENQYLKLERVQEQEWYDSLKPLREAAQELEKEVNALNDQAAKTGADIRNWEYDRDHNADQMKKLRELWTTENDKRPDIKDTCPTCGQALPSEQVETAQRKFNQAKSANLEQINAEGKTLKAKNDELQAKIMQAQESLDKIKAQREDLQTQLTEAKGELAVAEQKARNLEPTEDMQSIEREIDGITAQLESRQPIDTTEQKKAREGLQSKIATVDAAKKTRARIEELKKEEKTLAAEFEELERQLALMDRFAVSKVEMLEDRIAENFEIVRFKMFDQQINEGIRETCIVTLDGVPYPDMSNSERIRAGMDIIKTLQRHYGVHAPLWVDNAESITELPDMDCQVIRLVVDEAAPELVVEPETQKERRAANG